MKSPFEKNKLLAGFAAGVMGTSPLSGDGVSHHQVTEHVTPDYGKIFDRGGSETKEDNDLKAVAKYVLEAKKRIKELHGKNMHDQARAELSRAVDHLVQSYLSSSKKYSAPFLVAVSRQVYDLYLFDGGYCTTHDETIKLYEEGMAVSPRLALDIATLHHKDGDEGGRINVLSKGYELAHVDPDWHTKFDIGEEYALALGMTGKSDEALKVYGDLFGTYQGLIAKNMIAVDIHVQTIVDGGDFKKVEPYVNELAFQEYAKYRTESFDELKGLQK
ncbi:MAG: hypothetical protein Q8P56_05455 [Candidatus Uhrbacteria bacterium]|nr:hypothetical protein [Candidatus Uhrbacteria bacterium]